MQKSFRSLTLKEMSSVGALDGGMALCWLPAGGDLDCVQGGSMAALKKDSAVVLFVNLAVGTFGPLGGGTGLLDALSSFPTGVLDLDSNGGGALAFV